MSGISEKQLDDLERSLVGGPEFYSDKMQKRLIAEIRRLLAENERLKSGIDKAMEEGCLATWDSSE